MLAMSPSNHEIHRFTCCGSFVSSAPAGHPSRSLLAPVAREPSTPWLPALPACVVEVGLGSRCVTSADLHWWLCEPRTLHSWADCLHSPQLRRDPESANSSAVCEPAQWEPGDTRAHCQGWLLLRNTQVCPTLPPWNGSNPTNLPQQLKRIWGLLLEQPQSRPCPREGNAKHRAKSWPHSLQGRLWSPHHQSHPMKGRMPSTH